MTENSTVAASATTAIPKVPAKQVYGMINSPIPELQAAGRELMSKKLVRAISIDASALIKDISYRAWLEQNGLISADAPSFGRKGGSSEKEIEGVLGEGYIRWKNAIASFNEVLEKSGSPWRLMPFKRNLNNKGTRTEQSAPEA